MLSQRNRVALFDDMNYFKANEAEKFFSMLGKKLAFRFSWAAQMPAFMQPCLIVPYRRDLQATLQLAVAAVAVECVGAFSESIGQHHLDHMGVLPCGLLEDVQEMLNIFCTSMG